MYLEVDINISQIDPFSEILIARLNEINFESYLENKRGVKAYIKKELFDLKLFKDILSKLPSNILVNFSTRELPDKNWNQLWENSFEIAHVNDNCVIRSTFHKLSKHYNYELIIEPKMSFGTGHHPTTLLILQKMFFIDFNSKSVLDVGSGTGVLSILASKLNANSILALDVDKWAQKNIKENLALNNIKNVEFINSDIFGIKKRKFDIILVNISRNVILKELNCYADMLENNSHIILSGFLLKDKQDILQHAHNFGLKLFEFKIQDEWILLHLIKD